MTHTEKDDQMTSAIIHAIDAQLGARFNAPHLIKSLEFLRLVFVLSAGIKYNSDRDSVRIATRSCDTEVISDAVTVFGAHAYVDNDSDPHLSFTIVRLADDFKGEPDPD